MKKRVRGGIEKHYCDRCGKNIYDLIPKEPSVKCMGLWIPEFKMKRHCEHHTVFANRKKGVDAGEYCKDCYAKVDA